MKNIYAVYSQEGDMTFIMRDTFDKDGEPKSTECVGFYFGEPDESSTKFFIGKLKAKF